MDSKFVVLLISLVIGGGLGYAGASITLSPRIDEYTTLLAEKEAEYDALVAENIDNLNDFLILNSSFNALTVEKSSLELLHDSLSDEHEVLEIGYDVLSDENLDLQQENNDLFDEIESVNLEYEALQLSYDFLEENYDKLRECIPSGVDIPYSELKKSPEGNSRNELIGVCGQDYLIPAPVNADEWEVNITITSELSWQPVHIIIYTIYEDYPPDWLGQPFAPYARGDGEASISLSLNTSYAYVISVRDAYAKPFTGYIEECWYMVNTN